MIIVQVDNENLVKNLEVSHYEYVSYNNMLESAKVNGYNQEYWDLWSQYMEVCSEYETLKEHIRVEFIVPAVGEDYPGWWEIDFENKIITIHKD